MYKVVLVDDEQIVLTGIQKVYHLEDYGFTVAGAFTDAAEALEQLTEISPQLVITDMKMPGMSGLEFIGRAKELVPDAEFVVLSGHDDFVFAQESLKLGVADYLLKPVKKDAFAEMLEKMNRRIAAKLENQDYTSRVENWLHDNAGELANKFFVQLSEKDQFDEKLYQLLEKQNRRDIRNTRFLLIRMHLRTLTGTGDYLSSVEQLGEEVRERLLSYGYVLRFQMDDVISFLLLEEEETDGAGALQADWAAIEEETAAGGYAQVEEEILRYVDERSLAGDSLTVGISRVHDGLEQLFMARNECVRHIFMTDARLDIPSEEQGMGKAEIDIQLPYLEIEHLFQEAMTGNTKSVEEEIRKVYEPAGSSSMTQVRDFAGMITFLILLRIYQTQDRVDDSLQLVNRNLLSIRRIEQDYPSLERQMHLSCQAVTALAEAAAKQGSGSGKKIIQDALNYIEKHYCENISLMDVAQAIGISKNYLANLFKKELDITLINYVTNLRIEEAKRLLRKGDLKMYEIADAVGYKDYAYFSQLFKKHTGVTLSAYRSGI